MCIWAQIDGRPNKQPSNPTVDLHRLEVTQNPAVGTIISGSNNPVTLTISNNSQNEASLMFNAITTDTVKPVFTTTIGNQILKPADRCEASLPDYTNMVTVTDNHDTTFNIKQQPAIGTKISDSLNTVTLSATDQSGNTAKISFNVWVIDTMKGSLKCVEDQSVYPTNGSSEYIVNGFSLDPATASTACFNYKIKNNYNQSETLKGAKLPLGTTTITWTMTTEYGKSSSCSFDVIVNNPSSTNNYIATNRILYPNPTNGIVYIKMNSSNIKFIRIYGLLGNLVGVEHFVTNNEFDISSLNKGVYLVEIITHQERILTRITKQ